MLVTALGTVTVVSDSHPENAEAPIASTPFGILTEVSFLQFLNAFAGMAVMSLGSVTEVRLSQFKKAPDGSDVIPSGSDTETSLVAPEKEGAEVPLATVMTALVRLSLETEAKMTCGPVNSFGASVTFELKVVTVFGTVIFVTSDISPPGIAVIPLG